METTGELITLNLVEESDTATVIAIRNKILNTTVKGVPDIERVTLVQKDDEWVIQTTGSNIAKILDILYMINFQSCNVIYCVTLYCLK